MDVRFSVGLILIAVGGLLALLGGMGVFMPGPPGARPDLTLRLGCGGMGAFGALCVLLGLRLRNRAVADSPALRRSLEGEGAPTSRTGTAKPPFLANRPKPDAAPAPQHKPPVPKPPARVSFVYWLILGAFVLAVLGLLVGTLDFFQGAQQFRAVALVSVLLMLLAFPVLSLRGRRRRGRRRG